MSINKLAMEANLAVSKLATAPGADLAQRITALGQVQRQVEGQLRKLQAERELLNPISQVGGD